MAVSEVTATFVRPMYGKGQGLIPELLGVLPNFLAGFHLPFILLGAYYWFMLDLERTHPEALQSAELSRSQITGAFLAVSVLTMAGLTLWEFLQIGSNLVYDHKDLAATIGGSIASVLFFTKTFLVENKQALQQP